MNNISFLIGSGFSIPVGFPTVKDLNLKLSEVKSSDICIHTSGNVSFLEGQDDPNAHIMRPEQRDFFEKFIEFYCSTILGFKEKFHYETFYDYYKGLMRNGKSDEFENFRHEFNNKAQKKIITDTMLV